MSLFVPYAGPLRLRVPVFFPLTSNFSSIIIIFFPLFLSDPSAQPSARPSILWTGQRSGATLSPSSVSLGTTTCRRRCMASKSPAPSGTPTNRSRGSCGSSTRTLVKVGLSPKIPFTKLLHLLKSLIISALNGYYSPVAPQVKFVWNCFVMFSAATERFIVCLPPKIQKDLMHSVDVWWSEWVFYKIWFLFIIVQMCRKRWPGKLFKPVNSLFVPFIFFLFLSHCARKYNSISV